VTVQSVLCAVDFSAESRRALQSAIALTRRFAARLTVVFVNDPLLLAAASPTVRGRRRFVDRTRAELSRFVNHAARMHRPTGDNIGLVVLSGNPADEILRQAKRSRADILVLGSHGLSGIRKAFFGSTTEQVLRQATVPVLAVPPPSGRWRPSAPPTQVLRVVAPIDLAGEWQSDARRAADIALAFDAALVLLHVLVPIQAPPWLRPMGTTSELRRLEKAKKALERVRTTLFPDVRATSTVVLGNAAHEIARIAAGGETLVVMSLRGTAGVWGARRGAIAYHVLTQSSAPVLALPRRRVGGRFAARARKALHGVLAARDRAEIAGIDALLSAVAGRPARQAMKRR
jgi:nucleotide-binding universal stress UspA family protein